MILSSPSPPKYGSTMKLHSRRLSAALALGLLLGGSAASAQTKVQGFALEPFNPSPAGDAFFGVPSPWVGGHLELRGDVLFDYAHRPFQLRPQGNATGPTTDLVAAQGFLRAGISLALWDRLLIAADVPVALLQSGDSPPGTALDFHPPSGVAMGDVRFDLRGRLVGDYYDPFQLGVTGSIFVPSGSPDSYTGDGAVRGMAQLSIGGRAGSSVGFVWNASGGAQFHATGPLASVVFGGGAALTFLDERISVGPEVHGTVQASGSPFDSGTATAAKSTTAIELLVGAKARLVSGLTLMAAGGPGVAQAIGTPEFRVVGGLAWSLPPDRPAEKPKPVIGDKDGDGIRDDVDACPDVKGELQSDPAKDGCPLEDKDGDGVLDSEDACPSEAGLKSSDATKNGCQPDADEDGIADAKDACPDKKGVSDPDPKKNGCPGDKDGDGVIDVADACPEIAGPPNAEAKMNGCPLDPDNDGVKYPADACPTDAGPASSDPKQNGCPKLARLSGDEIVISTQVQFISGGKTKRETVDPVSDDLMKEIKDVINKHPEIVKIEVQGHTDDMGTEAFNLQLSQERADAVKKWLVDAGVPGDKLVAKGYGWEKPLGDNRVKTGRQKNRRVQFVVLERRK